MAAATVTLDKAYFETLLRRAQFLTSNGDAATSLEVPTVTIPRTEHENLISISRQYANLKRNLFRGGIEKETLAILIKDDEDSTKNGDSINHTADQTSKSAAVSIRPPLSTIQGNGGQVHTPVRIANCTQNHDLQPQNTNGNGFHSHSPTNDDNSFTPNGPDTFYDEGCGNDDTQFRSSRQQFDKFAKRTVQLCNLHESTTHQDVVDAVRGGMLLDIYLRSHDRTANVSFLEEAHAQEYFRHVKRHDLYIRGKRVDIRWNDRHFILPGHVSHKILIGATRNLVIINRVAKHTEQAIRDDLEHIHNLVVIKVAFSGNNTYISTNSVRNAIFARTCMMSRAVYKGSKIEWDHDECAAPLMKPQQYRQENLPPKRKDAPIMNRFQLLRMDDTDEDNDDTSGISFPTMLTATTVVA